jgi:hypothetical protein
LQRHGNNQQRPQLILAVSGLIDETVFSFSGPFSILQSHFASLQSLLKSCKMGSPGKSFSDMRLAWVISILFYLVARLQRGVADLHHLFQIISVVIQPAKRLN